MEGKFFSEMTATEDSRIGDTMETNQFYVAYNGKGKGPFTLKQLQHFAKTNQITPETPILVKGSTEWRRAGEIAGLFPKPQFTEQVQPLESKPVESTPAASPEPSREAPLEMPAQESQTPLEMPSEAMETPKKPSVFQKFDFVKSFDWKKLLQKKPLMAGLCGVLVCVVLIWLFSGKPKEQNTNLAGQTATDSATEGASRSTAEGSQSRGMEVVPTGNRYALLIGVNEYQPPIKNLQFCAKDAQLLAETFEQIGFPKENIICMTDGAEKKYQPTRTNIQSQLKLICGKMAPNDLLVVSFSGHGVMVKDKSYLCPSDARPSDVDTLVSRDFVYDLLKQSPAQQKLLLVDACRNELEEGSRAAADARAVFDPTGAKNYGFVLMASCDKGQCSWEIPELGNGAFTHFISEGLLGGAMNAQGFISVLSLASYVSDNTKNYVHLRLDELQVPTFKQDEATNFYLAKLDEAAPGQFIYVAGTIPSLPPDAFSWEAFYAGLQPTLEQLTPIVTEYKTVLKDYEPTSTKAQGLEAQIRKIYRSAIYPYYETTLRQREATLQALEAKGLRSEADLRAAVKEDISALEKEMKLFSAEQQGESVVNGCDRVSEQLAKIAEEKRIAEEVKKFNVPQETIAGTRQTLTVDGVEYAFRWCPAGTFVMGSPENEEDRGSGETQHQVTLTQGFWMLETEVTQAMWRSVMGSNPSYFKGDNLPVECVRWDDCQDFCRKLSGKIGMTITLPTEAQWEYACRAGTTGAYAGDLDAMGWYYDNSGGETHPVGQKKANAWGLYDMHGNVYEWCQDWYGDYPSGAVTDPTGPESGSLRVYRGGGWSRDAQDCRSANRSGDSPDGRINDLGFRPVVSQ